MTEAEERRPLLDDAADRPQATKIPWGQVFLLIFARILDLWYFFCVFPYIGEMLVSVGVEEAEIGFYAGLVEASFSAAECVFLLCFWTSLSEKIGRRPVMLICLVGISTSAVFYGFSQSAWQMILFRAMGGCFSGCSGMSRIMQGEITDSTNRAKVYSISSSTMSIPIMLGPVVGAALARPADRYPLFAHWDTFRRFPYLLPSLATASVGFTALLTNSLYLKETHKPGTGLSEEASSMSTTDLLRYPKVRTVLLLTTAFMTLEFSWTAMIPVFSFTSVKLGGLGWDISWISYIFLFLAAAQGLAYLVVFPPFLRLCGVREGLIAIGCFVTAAFTSAPLCNIALRNDNTHVLYPLLVSTGVFAVLTNMYWGIYALAINDASPGPTGFAKINSLSQVCATAVRTIGPPIATSLYAVGVQHQILRGQLAWAILASLSCTWVICMRWYPREPPKGEALQATVEEA